MNRNNAAIALNAGIAFGRLLDNCKAGTGDRPLSGDHMARLNYVLTGNSQPGSTPVIKTGVNVWDMVRNHG